MTKHDYIYTDCIDFWMRMGVRKEDNLMALALADLNILTGVEYEREIWEAYYCERFEQVRKVIMQPQFNENRGREGFLANSGL